MADYRPFLHVCCNDPDNGLFTGRAVALSIGSAEFEADDWEDGVRFVELPDGRIRLAGKVWTTHWSKDWVGNWCWNAYGLGYGRRTPRCRLVDFLKWLRGRGLFRMTCGPERLSRWFEEDRFLTDADLHHEICEALE